MKRAFFALALVALCCGAYADTLYNYGGDYVPEWKAQAVYKERFFENGFRYDGLSFFGGDPVVVPVLKGMKHNLILRMGLPDDYAVNADFCYLYQKIDTLNFNNLQTLSLFGEKYFDWWGALAGFKGSFWNDMPVNERLLDAREEMNVLLGIFLRPPAGMFKYSAGLYGEKSVLMGRNYDGALLAAAGAGLNIYSSEYQVVNFMLETALDARFTQDEASFAMYAAPQFYVEFFNDFYMVLGMEFYILAHKIYLNDVKQPRFLLKLNYTVNSDKRAVAPKEEVKPPVMEKKWWQIEGVDDEMIPETWKEDGSKKE